MNINEKNIFKNVYLKEYVINGNIIDGYQYLLKNNENIYAEKINNLFTKKKNYGYLNKEKEEIKQIVKIYHNYYKNIFWLKMNNIKSINLLLQDLNNLFSLNILSIYEMEYHLEKYLIKYGYYFFSGELYGYRNPYLFKVLNKKEYDVKIIDKNMKINIFFFSNILLNGWIEYLSLNKIKIKSFIYSNDNILFISKRFFRNLDKPNFNIMYLKYYAQMFYDLNNLFLNDQDEIEYRAKLIQLIYYPNIKCFKSFFLNQDNKVNNKIVKKIGEILNENKRDYSYDIYKNNYNKIKDIAFFLFKESENKLIKK